MLSHYRILDLADHRGLIAGMILADLGADVIAVEPPHGNPARQRGPFASEPPHDHEDSLPWLAWARGKRSIALDLDTDDGRRHFRQLARTADALIDSQDPDFMHTRGLDHEQLAQINPGLVYCAITPSAPPDPKPTGPPPTSPSPPQPDP